MNRLMHRGIALGLFMAVLLSGCGPRELAKKETYPTTGKIRLNGEPVRFARIQLIPTEEGVPAARGVTGADGSFVLRTYSNTQPDGAAEGEFTVELEDYDATLCGPIPQGQKPTKIPDEVKKSGKTVEVKSEDNNLTIDLP